MPIENGHLCRNEPVRSPQDLVERYLRARDIRQAQQALGRARGAGWQAQDTVSSPADRSTTVLAQQACDAGTGSTCAGATMRAPTQQQGGRAARCPSAGTVMKGECMVL